jgi:poly(hydroxyalkanoate) depolymerase family esterase
MSRPMRVLVTGLVLAAATLAGPARPAAAASLVQVSGFGANPGNLSMFSYRPDGVPPGAPLVVVLHGCGQTANEYFTNAGWRTFADRWRFSLVLPQTSSANNASACFNWFEPGDQARGQGEALSVKQMVDYAVANHGVDPARVFVTGLSAGGAMAAVMLAAYPDVFRGGAIIAGIAYKCATGLTGGVLCLSQRQNRAPQQWGDLVRGAFPGYAGARPSVAIWYGSNDFTVATLNADQLRDQWTNVHGIGQTPTASVSLPASTTRDDYTAGGVPVVQVYRVGGIGHGTPVDPGSAPDQCGTAGAFFLDSICSAFHIGRSWGLDGSQAPPSGPPAPAGLAVTGTSDSTVALSWSAVIGAASYRVYRGGALVGSPTTAAFVDSGLSPATTYSYAVAAVDAANAEGARSAAVSATTTGAAPVCVTSSNWAHVLGGRAHDVLGRAYANGSNQPMGLDNVFVTHTLRRTGPNFWVLADGGC